MAWVHTSPVSVIAESEALQCGDPLQRHQATSQKALADHLDVAHIKKVAADGLQVAFG